MTIEALFITALALIIIEIFVPSAGLLTFGGFVAFCAGLILLFLSDTQNFYGLSVESVGAIGVLIFITFFAFGYYVLKIYGKKITTGVESMIGKEVMVIAWTGNKGRIEYEGEAWRAIGDGDIKSGDVVLIQGYDNMTLSVTKKVTIVDIQ
jgi:membrane-bound serine protease (ClpP class)